MSDDFYLGKASGSSLLRWLISEAPEKGQVREEEKETDQKERQAAAKIHRRGSLRALSQMDGTTNGAPQDVS